MPFPLEANWTADDFRQGIIDHYWPGLAEKLANHDFIPDFADKPALLPDDYATIGAFLTNDAMVHAALIPLEEQIRADVQRRLQTAKPKTAFPTTEQDAMPYSVRKKEGGSASHFKSDKLLSQALRMFEAMGGFNHEGLANGTFFDEAISEQQRLAKKDLGTLHTGGGTIDADGKFQKPDLKKPPKDTSKPDLDAVKLPRGVPTVHGDLAGAAFNSVLLRHAYHFKDVQAGVYHGEYTHRLQWHAIMRAVESRQITLHNTPLAIYKSLGYALAESKEKDALKDRHLYLWEALFDTGEDETRAKFLKTAAVTASTRVCTCPENMNKNLMKLQGHSDNSVKDLWYLRVLLATRWKKRFDVVDAGTVTDDLAKVKDRDTNKTRMIVTSSTKPNEEVVGYEKGPAYQGTIKKDGVVKTVTKRDMVPVYGKPLPVKTLDDARWVLAWYLTDDTVK